MFDERPIGFFDSGVGGLTVLREVLRRLPNESTIYLGDNARAPYGPRSDDEVRRFSAECLDQLAARDVKAIVVACNTSSAVALNDLRLRYPLPIMGVVRPGAAAAALATRTGRIGVIATAATVRSHAYFQAIKDENAFLRVTELATPDLVPLVEAGQLEGPLVEEVVGRAIAPLRAAADDGLDTLLLGCTHYPLLAPVIERQMGGRVAIIDSASASASALAHLLDVQALHAPADATAEHVQLTTGDVDRFRAIAERLFGDILPDRAVGRRGERGVTTQARRRNDRSVGIAALAIGVAGLAIASRYVARRARTATDDGLVDWRRAEQIAVSRLSRSAGALPPAELRAAEPAYAAAMAAVVPLLETQLELPLPGVVERHAVVDRAGWARANLVTFESLIGRLEQQLKMPAGAGFASGVARLTNRFLTTQQVGFFVGYLGTRVLGQYDIALLSAEAKPGRLLFVEENIRMTAASLGVPLDDFRKWICLHETTHAFEFEANEWLRPYLVERLDKQLSGVMDQARSLQADGVAAFMRRLSESRGNPLTAFWTPEQRRLFAETQVVMSLLEGFSDWVMDEVGAQVVPNVRQIRQRFEQRRAQRQRGLDWVIARLTGLDLKLEQYRRGERFVSGVAAAGGRDAVRLLWQGPWALPTERELGHPDEWVARVAPQTLRSAIARPTPAADASQA